jgi:hypothetical protein
MTRIFFWAALTPLFISFWTSCKGPRKLADPPPPQPGSDAGSDSRQDQPAPALDALGADRAQPGDASIYADGGQTASTDAGRSEAGQPDAALESGGVVWRVTTPAPGAIARDSEGNVLVASRGRGMVMAKYAPSGMELWQKRLPGGSLVGPEGLKATADGSFVMTGAFEGGADFGGQIASAVGGVFDAFIASYSSQGQLQRLVTFGSSESNEKTHGLLIDQATGDWFVTGWVGSLNTAVSVGGTMISGGFVSRLRPTGEVIWTRPGAGYSLAGSEPVNENETAGGQI